MGKTQSATPVHLQKKSISKPTKSLLKAFKSQQPLRKSAHSLNQPYHHTGQARMSKEHHGSQTGGPHHPQTPPSQQQQQHSHPFAPLRSKTSSAAYSPPMSLKSKKSKSKRYDRLDTAPLSKQDYFWLLVYYICLYCFYLAFWYSLWRLYLLTTDPNVPRREPPNHSGVRSMSDDELTAMISTMNDTEHGRKSLGHLRRNFMLSCNNSS